MAEREKHMVMRSFRAVRLKVKLARSRHRGYIERVMREFGGRVTIRSRGDQVLIGGDAIADYRVRDRLLELKRGRARG